MAQTLELGTVQVKQRHIFGWLGLGIITLGIYVYVWYYKINRELRDLGEAYGDEELASIKPGLAVLAIFIPIANFVSMHRAGTRVIRAQRLVNRPVDYGMGMHWLLIILGFWPCYVQSGLNNVWGHGHAILSGNKPATEPAAAFATH